MGTPDFAAGILKKLIDEKFNVVAVFTQPDRPKGRGKEMAFSDVKTAALQAGIKNIYQPEKINNEESVNILGQIEADAFVVAAYGQLIPEKILEMPPLGCINVHASLLPKYRGAAPIQASILNGDKESGITTILMAKELDAGDILLQESILLDEKETTGTLFDKLQDLGANLIVKTLNDLKEGKITPLKQDETKVSFVRQINKKSGNLDFNKSAKVLEREIRAYNPWPTAFTNLNDRTLKIWDADVLDDNHGKNPGEVIKVTKDSLIVACKEGALKLNEIQLSGKKRMNIADFLRGFKIQEGEIFQ